MLNHMSGRNFCPHYPLLLIVAMVAVVLLWPGQALGQACSAVIAGDASSPYDDLQDAINSLHPDGGTIVVSGLCTNPIRNRTVDTDCLEEDPPPDAWPADWDQDGCGVPIPREG